MKGMFITALALAVLALAGCGEKGAKESPTSEKKAPSPVKAPKMEIPPAPPSEPEPVSEPEPEAKPAPAPAPAPAPIEKPDPEVKPATSTETDTPEGIEAPEAEIPKNDLVPLDLSTIDSTVKLVLMAPGGAEARDDYGSIEIAKEPDFQMEFSEEDEVDFLARKKEIEANNVNKLKKYHVDTEDTLVYETEIMGKSEFHFLATISVDGTLYLCEDQKGPVFSHAAVTAMMATCRSARKKEHNLPMPSLDGNPNPTMSKIDLD